ncbi:Gfo/Idh/MocA family protein [Mangrovicoccus ximenensis]|uniref:Gfo/Idh/MocA family protein n=1 Tax=Mangrovicoccus ximenensis TaxID=1911570 RepID=UPI000D37676C|nr:Gfo/Idh/MocA family oxidoreductase [Mangrovicoccus ximenensis]
MIELAVFGAGRMGQIHARNAALHPGLNLKFIADPIDSPARDALLAMTGATLATPEEIFADPAIAGVVVASSTDSHAELIRAAAEAGKAVFADKPISLDFAAVLEVAAAVEAAGVPSMLGFQRRYDAPFRALKQRIDSGASGRLETVLMQSRDPSPPPASYARSSGGFFRDSAIHDMDMARYLLEEPVARVWATGSCLVSEELGAIGDIDTGMIALTTVSGRIATLMNSRRGPMGYDQRLEAFCAAEVLSVGNQRLSPLAISAPDGETLQPPMNYFPARFAQAYADEMDAFARLIAEGTPPLATMADGLEAQRLVEAAIRSLETGLPVDFAPDWRP